MNTDVQPSDDFQRNQANEEEASMRSGSDENSVAQQQPVTDEDTKANSEEDSPQVPDNFKIKQ